MPEVKKNLIHFTISIIASLVAAYIYLLISNTSTDNVVSFFSKIDSILAFDQGNSTSYYYRHSVYIAIFSIPGLLLIFFMRLGFDFYSDIKNKINLGTLAQLAGIYNAYSNTYRAGMKRTDFDEDIINSALKSKEKKYYMWALLGIHFVTIATRFPVCLMKMSN